MAMNSNFSLEALKSKKLPIGVFVGMQKGPSPARIFITLNYSEDFDYLRSYKGFVVKSFNAGTKPVGTISFEIPVMPPTVDIDTGNQKDTEMVARVGEVVLPKYKKARQVRWSSFFPYDTSAPYLSTSVRNLTWGSLTKFGSSIKNFASQTVGSLLGLSQENPTPAVYISIFEALSKSEEPFTMSMTFYEGGNMSAKKYTLDSFKTNPENNGDFQYSISIVEWTDIRPKLLNNNGDEVKVVDISVPDKIKFKSIKNIQEFWRFAKQCYPTVSKGLVWAFSTYNGVRNLIFEGVLIGWKIKGSLQDLGGRFGILSNMFGLAKITSKDTKEISSSLKKLSFSKASRQLADFINKNIST
jgi:hypothetical protein